MSSPLSGLKVLDFSTLLPGPYASMILADMGAEVCRVESPHRPDLMHQLPPLHGKGADQTSFAHLTLNRNKHSIMLDLKQPQSVDVIKRMVEDYDIVLEQFRPGVMQKLGLDYTNLSAINPRLIYCSLTGYGQTGSHKDKAGHDINYLALSGLASYSGTADTGPVLSAAQIADVAGGSHHTVMAILAAVIARHGDGKGQWLDISMCDAAFSLNAMFAAGALGTGNDPQCGSTPLNGGGFYGYYQTRDDQYLSVGGLEPKFAKAFFELLEQPQWFALSMQHDIRVQQRLKADLAALFIQQDSIHWCTLFNNHDVCVEPVLSLNQAANSTLLQERNMLIEAKLGDHTVRQIAPVVKFSGPQRTFNAANKPGCDSYKILQSLGYTEQEISLILNSQATVGKTNE
jgi:crotonobetainyl-CoA:carnitine CoA-transferase CaiB-like acyl-CoA transferase